MVLKGLVAEIFYYIMMIPLILVKFALPLLLAILLIIFLVKGIKYFNKKRDK